MSEVTDLLHALRIGSMTLEQVARRFRERTWPSSKQPSPSTREEWVAAPLRDPDPYIPGSFDDVVAACDRGEITEDQFQVLADAVADAIGRKDSQDS